MSTTLPVTPPVHAGAAARALPRWWPCSQVFMTGLSMGGTLTLYTAAKHADVIKGAIPINATVQINSPDRAGLALVPTMPATVPGIGSNK